MLFEIFLLESWIFTWKRKKAQAEEEDGQRFQTKYVFVCDVMCDVVCDVMCDVVWCVM